MLAQVLRQYDADESKMYLVLTSSADSQADINIRMYVSSGINKGHVEDCQFVFYGAEPETPARYEKVIFHRTRKHKLQTPQTFTKFFYLCFFEDLLSLNL